jgi:hypothetical protein
MRRAGAGLGRRRAAAARADHSGAERSDSGGAVRCAVAVHAAPAVPLCAEVSDRAEAAHGLWLQAPPLPVGGHRRRWCGGLVVRADVSRSPLMVRTHTVVAGDTLSALALRYGTTVAELARLNSIRNVDLIHVGQVLALPLVHATPEPRPTGPAPAPTSPPTQITVVGGTVTPPPVVSDRACPTWWPDAACHVWPRMPLVLAVLAAGAVILVISRPGARAPRRTKKRRR